MNMIEITRLSEEEIEKRNIRNWPVWEKGISRFDWQYAGDEECYILEGDFSVETPEGKYDIKPGDFVRFKNGLKCVWEIRKKVTKHYNFP